VKVNVYLKSGQTMTFEANKLESQTNGLYGGLTSLKWTIDNEAETKLFFIDLEQVAGITTVE
jgi:hypothetical protein